VKIYSAQQLLKIFGIMLTGLAFVGCSAMNTSLNKRELDVQTKTSDTIFLEPVRPDKRIVFISVRNTSDKELDIKSRIKLRLINAGFKITDDPDQAQFMLQANILKVGKDNLKSSKSYIDAGFNGAALGSAVSSRSDSGKGIVIGALVGVIADSLVDDTLFTMVTDLQVRERPQSNEGVTQKQDTYSTQGEDTSVTQVSDAIQVNWKTYHTRIVSTANQANLDFEDALPALEEGLVRSIAGLFAE
jgi:outer membrane lipoprotein SlyB